MNIDEIKEQLGIYGKVLSGETKEQKAILARGHYLKIKMRQLMEQANLGDINDIAADLNKSLLLGFAIVLGVVTDATIISRYKAYVADQILLYGKEKAMMDKLEANAAVLAKWLGSLKTAKTAINAAKNIEEVDSVDLT